jgi:hypothetical protein
MFYVYVLYRPWNMIPCYVGKGQGDRVHHHSRLGDKHANPHLAAIFKKAGGEIPFEIVFETLDEQEAFSHEIDLIVLYGRKVDGTGVLANRTQGGEGTSGLRWAMKSEDIVKRSEQITKMWQDPAYREKASKRMLGNRYFENAVFSDSTRESARQRSTGNTYARGRKHSSEARAAMSEKAQGGKEQNSARAKARWADPDKRASYLATRETSTAYQNRNRRVQSTEEKAKRVASRLRTLEDKRAAT